MALLRRRPRISVSVPKDIRPGQTVVVEARLDATSAVPVNWINAELECEELITFGADRNATRSLHPYLRLIALLMGKGTLPAGKSVLRCKFALPPGFPPTYRGARVRCCYTLTVHVSIPWWPDRKSTFDILVGPNNDDPPDWRPYNPPAMYGTHPDGPKGNDLAIECSLDRRILEPGSDLRGMVALTNLASHRVRQLSIALVSAETIRHSSRRSEIHDSARFVLSQSVPPGTADGESLAFQMRIPDSITPSRKSGGWDLEWYLEVQAHLSLARNVKLTIPVTVVPRGAAKDKRLRAPPTVGSERVSLLWDKVARQVGWELDGEVLRGTVGDVHVARARLHG